MIWLGSEESYIQLQETMAQPVLSSWDRDEDTRNPLQFQVIEGVALGKISGPILSESSWRSRFLGVISYADIIEAVAGLADQTEVRSVLLTYSSPGGAALNCEPCASFLRDFGETTKPLFSFTDSMAASASMWLYAAGLGMYSTPASQLGSVGALMVHSDHTQRRLNAGIKDTVFRSAPQKALGHPYEPLTAEGEAEINEELQFYHNQFVDGLTKLYGVSRKHIAEKVATGALFRGQAAVDLKISDGLLSLEAVVGKLASKFRKPKAK